jgi:N-acetyl-anhydromuramyl-L-alanine amidase AmpD
MALKTMASILVRPRSALWVGVTLVVAGATAGCARGRQSYRPVYTSPATVSTPCKNCGTGATVTTDDPGMPPVTSVPSPSEPSILDSPATSSSTTSPSGSGKTRSSTVEPQAKSRLGGEPGFDETGANQQNSTTPPPPPKPLGTGPAVQGPTTSLSPSDWDPDSALADQTASTGSKRVRRTSLSERLKPFLDESSTNELIYPNKADRPWRYIVLHHSAADRGNYDQIDAEHRKILGIDGCGYHFVIGNGNGSGDGQIEVAQRWTNQKQGVHCRNARTHDVDEYGIGICLVGDLDKQAPTPRQIAAAKALIAHLSTRYDIAQGRVQTHAHLAATKTVCPGRHFPNNEILAVTKETDDRRPVRAAWKVVRETKPSY